MVRLHVLDNQIIRLSSVQNICQIVQPFVSEVNVHSIHNSDLIVINDVGVVGHSVWHNILAFEKIYLVIVDSDIFDSFCNMYHVDESPSLEKI